MRFLFLIVLCAALNAQNYKQIAYFHEGGSSVTIYPILAFDANHNTYPELIFWVYRYLIPPVIRMQEYHNYNRYFPVDSIRNHLFENIGKFDGDNKTDLLTTSGGYLYIFESVALDSYPTHLVWKSDYSYSSKGGIHVADLDQDGRTDFLFAGAGPQVQGLQVYENIGDNQYALVWIDDTLGLGGYNYTSGDFDQDGRIEFVTGSLSGYPCAIVYECTGDNQYEFVFCDTIYPSTANSHDVWFGNDLDQDGKPEFIIGSAPASGGSWAYQFRVYEATADNTYEVSYSSDIVYRPASLSAGRGSWCGDVDGDGIDEVIWTVQDNWYIYKAFGNNNFQRVFTAYPAYNDRLSTRVYVYDLNGNGYPEIIETGEIDDGGPDYESETIIWEIEAVKLLYPNGGEVFQPNDTVEIKWRTFDPPGCDSLSLFFSVDSGYTYDMIATGIPAAETTYQWIVPDTTSSQCMLMIWAYGPGTGWDFTDSTFSIGVGVSEGRSHKLKGLRIYPNPSHGQLNLDLPDNVIELNLFDAAGRQIKRLQPSPKFKLDLPPGIYFFQIKMPNQTRTEKLVILK